jgi:transposase InsO family protein
VSQQLRNATDLGVGPRFLIRDRDDKYGGEFDRIARGVGTKVLKTPVRAPKANAFCERFLGSVRRECLEHIIPAIGEQPHRCERLPFRAETCGGASLAEMQLADLWR